MSNKYPEHIMKYVRQNMGLEDNDTSMDDDINSMSKERVLDRVCNWNGLINYGSTIIGWIEDIYKLDLSED